MPQKKVFLTDSVIISDNKGVNMNYYETLNYLYTSTPVFERVGASAYKEGLSNTIELDDYFKHPHNNYKTIHVAGTNGKGSTSHSLAAILQKAGYRVGLFTSPHLIDFKERIRVDGIEIEEQYVIDFVEKHKSFFEPLHPSFFEIVTAMAFKYFADKNVDIAVIEVGLGGRLDCTNIITPVLSIITNISYDHTGFLGNKLADIAGEKAGIIKTNIPVVIGEYTEETRCVFENMAKSTHSQLIFADTLQLSDNEISKILSIFELKGDYQKKNLQTILSAVSILKNIGILPTSVMCDKIVIEALANVCQLTGLRGRWEIISNLPRVVCDTGHNVAAWEYLIPQLKSQKCETLRIVFGMVDDKDIDSVMNMLPKNAVYYFCQASTHRAVPSHIVMQKALERSLNGNCFDDVKSAYDSAIENAADNDFIFVGGSSYVVADLLSSSPEY